MSAQRFSTGQHFLWQEVEYEVKRLLPESRLLIEQLATTELQQVAFTVLAQALFAGELRFVTAAGSAPPAAKESLITLADYPPHLRALAEYRWEVIRPLLALAPTARTRAQVTARGGGSPPSPPSRCRVPRRARECRLDLSVAPSL
jgi:hypothetical protein